MDFFLFHHIVYEDKGRDVMQTLPGKRTALLTVSLILSACGGGGGGGGTVPDGTPVATFTKWSNVLPGSTVTVHGSGQQVSGTWDPGTQRFTNVSLTPAESEGYSATLTFGQDRELTRLLVLTPDSKSVVLDKTAGDIFTDLTLAPGSSPQFVGAVSPATGNVAIMANPINLGWEYQSFGVWESVGTDGRTFGAMSVGNNAGTAIQGTGTATFTGYATGSYVNDLGKGSTALAELRVDVNFVDRTLDFSTTNTRTSENFADLNKNPFTPNESLNLAGTLTYAAGTNSFTGPVRSVGGLTGDSTGQFYGPTAEELGGVFFLQGTGVETYAGAYGAAR
jgi:hypothetical protein